MGKQCQIFILGGSKITADGDCSHGIKRCLLLGRKVMTNLDSILKTRDITLPTKVHLVKAMVFPVVIVDVRVGQWRQLNTEELMLLNCGVGEDSWESLGLQGDPTSPFWRRSALGVHWKDMLKLKLQYFGHLMWRVDHWKRPWCWEGLGAGGEGDDRGWDAGWHHRLDGHEFEWTPVVGDGQGALGCCDSCGRKESDTTKWLNWTELNWMANHLMLFLQFVFPSLPLFLLLFSHLQQ